MCLCCFYFCKSLFNIWYYILMCFAWIWFCLYFLSDFYLTLSVRGLLEDLYNLLNSYKNDSEESLTINFNSLTIFFILSLKIIWSRNTSYLKISELKPQIYLLQILISAYLKFDKHEEMLGSDCNYFGL